MQLKIKRSQRDGGVISKNVIFCIDARVEFTAEEERNLRRYKLYNQVIYNSEASRALLDRGAAHTDGSTRGALKSLAYTALAAMRLNISVSSLARGQHIECKSMDELLGAENALLEACENLKGYLDTAATFDGREVLVDFATGTPTIVAQSVAPDPALMMPAPAAPTPALPPAEVEEVQWTPEDVAPAATDTVDESDYEPSSPLDQLKVMFEDSETRWLFALIGIAMIGLLALVKCAT